LAYTASQETLELGLKNASLRTPLVELIACAVPELVPSLVLACGGFDGILSNDAEYFQPAACWTARELDQDEAIELQWQGPTAGGCWG
jgi:hypothetical protein